MKRVLGNIQKGYAEAYYYLDDAKKEYLCSGCVETCKVPIYVDLHNDIIEYTKRWFAYLHFKPEQQGLWAFYRVGRVNTGYASRSLALQGIEKAILDVYGPRYKENLNE